MTRRVEDRNNKTQGATEVKDKEAGARR